MQRPARTEPEAAPANLFPPEGPDFDRKALRLVCGRTADFSALAADAASRSGGLWPHVGSAASGRTREGGHRPPRAIAPSLLQFALPAIRPQAGGPTCGQRPPLRLRRPAPTAREGVDSVHVAVPRRVVRPEAIVLLREADARFHLRQRERIAPGLLAQTEGLTGAELARRLELEDAAGLGGWLQRLLDEGLVQRTGRTRAVRYFVPPALLRTVGLDLHTTLRRVQPHRLRALILEDLERYPESSSGDIHRRIGPEIPERTFGRALGEMARDGRVVARGRGRWRRYRAAGSIGHEGDDGR